MFWVLLKKNTLTYHTGTLSRGESKVDLSILPCKQRVLGVFYIGIGLSVCQAVHISRKRNFSSTDIDETLHSCSIRPEYVHESR